MPNPPSQPVKKRQRILVMRYRFIGDTLLTVPFLRNLRAAYPEAHIDMLVAPNSGELLQDCPYINNLIVYDVTRKHVYENPMEDDRAPRSFWSYVSELRRRRYDTAFVLKRSFSSAALAFLAGIPERIGFNTEGRGLLLTKRVPYDKTRHEIDCFLDVLKAAGVPVIDRHLEAWWNERDMEKAREALNHQEGDTHVVLHLTSSNPAKQWPPERGLALAEWLLSHPAVHVHALGGKDDYGAYQELRNRLPAEVRFRFRIHCGMLNLLESMALLHQMDLAVGVDSGTLHMASAAGIPVVALFGPMDERKWAPPGSTVVSVDVPCRPCNLDVPCRFEFQCMTQLDLEQVKAACQTLCRF